MAVALSLTLKKREEERMFAQRKILVVEDNEINRAMLCELLSPQYTVLEAKNGQEALHILKDRREEVSLILLDIVMPIMDGYTFLSIIKRDPAYSSIPVIVTTQSDNPPPLGDGGDYQPVSI